MKYERDVLNERDTTHGNYKDVADIAQVLKNNFRACPNWNNLKRDQIESLEMIATKVSRILHGDPDHVDSWEDISGYADLVATRLKLENSKTRKV